MVAVYRATLRTEGGCLDVVGAGTESGTNVDWYPCNGTARPRRAGHTSQIVSWSIRTPVFALPIPAAIPARASTSRHAPPPPTSNGPCPPEAVPVIPSRSPTLAVRVQQPARQPACRSRPTTREPARRLPIVPPGCRPGYPSTPRPGSSRGLRRRLARRVSPSLRGTRPGLPELRRSAGR